MMVFLTHGRAAPHVEGWELLTAAEGRVEKEDFSFGDTDGSDRGHTGTAIRVEEPEFMAWVVLEKSAVRFNYSSKSFILRAVP